MEEDQLKCIIGHYMRAISNEFAKRWFRKKMKQNGHSLSLAVILLLVFLLSFANDDNAFDLMIAE